MFDIKESLSAPSPKLDLIDISSVYIDGASVELTSVGDLCYLKVNGQLGRCSVVLYETQPVQLLAGLQCVVCYISWVY